MFKKVILFFLVFILISVILEFSARKIFFYKNKKTLSQSFMYATDSVLGYKLNNHYKGDFGKFYNGFRTYPYEEKKNIEKKRICFLGASAIFGHGQKDIEKTIPSLLSSKLKKVSKEYEVINLGIPGYGSSHIIQILKNDVFILEPDIIVINLPVLLLGCLQSQNDWCPNNVYCSNQTFERKISACLYQNSVVYIQLKKILMKLFVYPNNVFKVNKEVPSVLVDQQYQNYLKIFEICRSLNSKTFVIEYPKRNFDDPEYRANIEILKKAANKYKIEMIDCSSIFRSMSSDELAMHFVDDNHLKTSGNKLIAKKIYEAILNQECQFNE